MDISIENSDKNSRSEIKIMNEKLAFGSNQFIFAQLNCKMHKYQKKYTVMPCYHVTFFIHKHNNNRNAAFQHEKQSTISGANVFL